MADDEALTIEVGHSLRNCQSVYLIPCHGSDKTLGQLLLTQPDKFRLQKSYYLKILDAKNGIESRKRASLKITQSKM